MSLLSQACTARPVCFALCFSLLTLFLPNCTQAHDAYDPTEEIERIRAEIKSQGYSWTAGGNFDE